LPAPDFLPQNLSFALADRSADFRVHPQPASIGPSRTAASEIGVRLLPRAEL